MEMERGQKDVNPFIYASVCFELEPNPFTNVALLPTYFVLLTLKSPPPRAPFGPSVVLM